MGRNGVAGRIWPAVRRGPFSIALFRDLDLFDLRGWFRTDVAAHPDAFDVEPGRIPNPLRRLFQRPSGIDAVRKLGNASTAEFDEPRKKPR